MLGEYIVALDHDHAWQCMDWSGSKFYYVVVKFLIAYLMSGLLINNQDITNVHIEI